MENNDAPKKEIKNLLSVIGAGIASALAIALIFLNYYSPTGTYLAKNVLLSPENLKAINYSEKDPRTGKSVPYIFDGLEFNYFDRAQKQWKKHSVSMQEYEKFFAQIGNLRSLSDVSDEVIDLFTKETPSTLTFKMRHANEGQNSPKAFIDVNFAQQGDYFRAELRDQSDSGWAYFFSPEIFSRAYELFVNP